MQRSSIGKRNEFVIWSRLLKEGIDVYPSLVDDKGIDGLVGFDGRYFEVQIKSGQNWNTPRGFSFKTCSKNPKRIFIIYNYLKDQCIYLTGKQIFKERTWRHNVQWEVSQLKWNKETLARYSVQNLNSFIRKLKTGFKG